MGLGPWVPCTLPACPLNLAQTRRSDSSPCITSHRVSTQTRWTCSATCPPRSPLLIISFTSLQISPVPASLSLLDSKIWNRMRSTTCLAIPRQFPRYNVPVPSRDLELGVMASSFSSIPRLHATAAHGKPLCPHEDERAAHEPR